MDKVIKELHQHLVNAGFKSSIVSAQHLPYLQRDLNKIGTDTYFFIIAYTKT